MHGFNGWVDDYTECLMTVGIMAQITTKQYNLDILSRGDLALNRCYHFVRNGVDDGFGSVVVHLELTTSDALIGVTGESENCSNQSPSVLHQRIVEKDSLKITFSSVSLPRNAFLATNRISS